MLYAAHKGNFKGSCLTVGNFPHQKAGPCYQMTCLLETRYFICYLSPYSWTPKLGSIIAWG